MKEIKLTQGYVALVDDEDYIWLSKFSWSVLGSAKEPNKKYAVRAGVNKSHLSMHREIMAKYHSLPYKDKSWEVDHIDNNRCNNQKYNLRVCTREENARNRVINSNKIGNTLKGVIKRSSGKYRARIRINKKLINLGTYTTEEAAAKRYDAAAVYLFGEFANINFPEYKEDYLRQCKELEKETTNA